MSSFPYVAVFIYLIIILLCGIMVAKSSNKDQVHDAYVINLNKHSRRWYDTKNELSQLTFLRPQRIEAFDTRGWTMEQFRNHENQDSKFALLDPTALSAISNGYRVDHHELTSGSVGCFMSHMRAWERVVANCKSDDDIVFIFEDDIRLPNGHLRSLKRKLKQLISKQDCMGQCDILLLSRGKQNARDVQNYQSMKIFPVQAYFGNWSYVLTKRSAAKLLCKITCIDQQLDWKLSSLAKTKEIIIFGSSIPFFLTRNLKSSTQNCQGWSGIQELYTLVD